MRLISVRMYDLLWSINCWCGINTSKSNLHYFQICWQSTNPNPSDHNISNDVSLRRFNYQYRRSFTLHFIYNISCLAPRIHLPILAVIHASRQTFLLSRSADPGTQNGGLSYFQSTSLYAPAILSHSADSVVNTGGWSPLDSPPYKSLKCVELSDGILFRPPTSKTFNGW